MGTSNWQNIPYCVEVLRAIAPQRVLDIGVGFGRWGMIVREFCEVWNGRVHPDKWSIDVQGIEAFAKNIQPYHGGFYNKVHIGDAQEVFPTLEGTWDLIIFGDVLEHFSKDDGAALLSSAITRSAYVLVTIPLGEHWEQDEAYGNKYERHLSEWEEKDFDAYGIVTKKLFKDYIHRPFGSFLLSKEDPKKLKRKLHA